jgi:hypothetical protein
MPKTTFSSDELSQYFNGQLKHKAYNETVVMAHNMCVHAEGIYPKSMIEERRPSEGRAVKEYREKIWKPITKPIFHKVMSELNKIRRSSDWTIKYDDGKVPPRINQEETMKVYCEEQYPFFNSVTNWVFKVLLPGYCKDANALIAVMPVNSDIIPNEYLKPFGYFFPSECVIEFVQDDHAIIKSTDKVLYTDANGAKFFGEVYYIFTTQSVLRYQQVNAGREFRLSWGYNHNMGRLPVFRVEGLYKKSLDGTFIFESRLSPMLPRLDEALREYSDLQAEVVQHVFNEKWEIVSDDCPTCKGEGKIKGAGFNSEKHVCTSCDGTGAKPRGPYSNIMVKQPMAGEAAVATPPAGYIQKNTDIVKIQDERIEKHEFKALSAINMEYLSQTPLNESGTAKEVDKDSLNNFVHAIAEDIVSTMDRLYFFIGEYRHSVIIPNADDRKDLLPYINVPDKFDLLSSAYLEDKISKVKEGKGNPIIINAMEEDYVNKVFVGDNALREKVLLSIRLDPLSGISEEDKMTRLSNKGISETTYVISCNIKEFIDRALDEKGEAFYSMKLKDQKTLMVEYATELVTSNSTVATILSEFDAEGNPIMGGGGGLIRSKKVLGAQPG